jgi:hypothetical protein
MMSRMTLALPDPPDSLSAAPREFYDELRRMLAVVQPTQIHPDPSSVKFESEGVVVELVHATRDDWQISATVTERDAIVFTGWAHEHFFPAPQGFVDERPWTTEIVDFIAEILRGEIEVQTTLRGKTPLSVRHFAIGESGERMELGHTVLFVPAWFLFWRPKRKEIERSSFL